MTTVNLELHWPPSINETYEGAYRGGRLRMKQKAKDWKTRNAWFVKAQLPHGHQPMTGELHADVAFTPPSRRGDIDNRLKIVFDCLEAAGVFENDRQIKSVRLIWNQPEKPGFVRLALSPFTPDAQNAPPRFATGRA